MRSPIAALIWEIWQRSRRTSRAITAIVLSAWLFNFCFAGELRATVPASRQLLTINCLLAAASILLVFNIFNYTEFNPQKEWTGFPYRLFAFPITSLTLISVPIFLGVAAVELVYLAWLKFVFVENELLQPGWFAVLLGALHDFLSDPAMDARWFSNSQDNRSRVDRHEFYWRRVPAVFCPIRFITMVFG